MKVIITVTFCCDNLWKSIVSGSEKKPEKLKEFFLLLCGYSVRGLKLLLTLQCSEGVKYVTEIT